MSLRELTDVLTAPLYHDFLLSFMLTGCDDCIESDSKGVQYLHETGTNSDRREFVSTSIHFSLMRLHETGLRMKSDRSDFVSVAGPRREILVPI